MISNGERPPLRTKPMGPGDLFVTLIGTEFIVTQRVEDVLVHGDEFSLVNSSVVCIVDYKNLLN